MIDNHLVLVVEDDISLRESVRDALVDEGYQVLTAEHGREALELLMGGARPCLILLDLMMPIMSGWELMDELRARPGLDDIPVVVVSAFRDRLPTGAAEFIGKPVDLNVLLSTVENRC